MKEEKNVKNLAAMFEKKTDKTKEPIKPKREIGKIDANNVFGKKATQEKEPFKPKREIGKLETSNVFGAKPKITDTVKDKPTVGKIDTSNVFGAKNKVADTGKDKFSVKKQTEIKNEEAKTDEKTVKSDEVAEAKTKPLEKT